MRIELHRHSRWSLLDGSGSGEQYAKRAAELDMPALAITDHGTLAGVLEHMDACREANVFPIVGIEIYFRENRLVEPHEDERRHHMTLLAMNFDGWLNIQRLSSEAYASGMLYMRGSYKPCADWELLARYSKGIFCMAGCIAGMFAQNIIRGDEPAVVNVIQRLKSIYGDNLAVELHPHDFDDQRLVNLGTYRIAYEQSVPMVAVGDTHMPFKEWVDVQDTMLKLATGSSNKIEKKKRESGEDVFTMRQENPTLYLMSEEEMMYAFAAWHQQLPSHVIDDAIHYPEEIVKRFMPFAVDKAIKMPRFTHDIVAKVDEQGPPVNVFIDPDQIVKDVVKRWCTEGLDELRDLYPKEHWLKYSFERYRRQLEHEWEVFDKIGMHVWRYMFMVAGEIRWARRNDIIVGPGRGSAAGTLTAYTTGITDIDPLPYDLMFERFINENRKGMPDIDIDFMPGERGRDRVKAHTASIYGEHNVIDIAAYQTYGPRAALRAVCRVFDDEIDFPAADRYAKALDALKPTDKVDLEECAEMFDEIADFKQKYPKLWAIAVRIEGHPFTQSVHASGVLVKPADVEIPTAVKYDADSGNRNTVTAWPDTREQLANHGFLKIDYLVIDGLIRQYEILKALCEREGTPIDLRRLPVRWDPYACDSAVMEGFSKGRTLGIWQMEGKGTIPVLKAIKPENMHDLAAVNALIRPGPRGAGITDSYAKRKHGQEPITYWHEAVEPVLKKTYGLMIYQEQMMEIAVQLGDFTRTEADDLRKAMGKKYREGIKAVIKFLDDEGYGTKFKHNAAFKVGEQMATSIWEDHCIKFGGYSFNASHAYAYGLISYHDGLLKTLAPADFYAWLLTFTKSKDLPAKLSGAMREGAHFGTKIKPPEINLSDMGFKVLDRQTILYGLEAVKGVGPAGCKEIFEHRPFRSYEEFDQSVARRAVNKNARLALISSGAFDAFNMRLFMSESERAENEEKYIGVRLSGKSDLEKYAALIEETAHTEDEFDDAGDGDNLCLGGEVTGIKTVVDKNGNEMAFVTLAHGADSFRVTLFSHVWAIYGEQLQLGKVVFFEGTKQISDRYGPGFIGKDCMALEALIAYRLGQQGAVA